jgi:archaetidylinositol phosphate synthase
MNLFAVRKQADKVLHPLVSTVAKVPLHANDWTMLGALIGLGCGAAFLYGWWFVGIVLFVVRGLVDHVDGYVARNRNQRSTFGAVMDDVCDRWVLGIMYTGGCLNLANDYPHVLIVLGFGITGSLCNALVKLSIYAEAQQEITRVQGKIGHPVDTVGAFGSAEFMIYFGFGVLFTALLDDPRPMLAGAWAVAIMSHLSLLQRVAFAWKRYRGVDPGLADADEEPAESTSSP